MAVPLGGLLSEKLVDRSGVADSNLLIGRVGVGDSSFQVGFGPRLSTLSATDVYMDGGAHATLRGRVTTLNGLPQATVWWEWGYDTAYGNTVGTQTITGIGVFEEDISGFDPNRVVYFRFAGEGDGVNYGASQTLGGYDILTTATHRMLQVVTFVWIAVVILAMFGLVYSGLPLVVCIIIGAIVVILGTAGVSAILEALRSMW